MSLLNLGYDSDDSDGEPPQLANVPSAPPTAQNGQPTSSNGTHAETKLPSAVNPSSLGGSKPSTPGAPVPSRTLRVSSPSGVEIIRKTASNTSNSPKESSTSVSRVPARAKLSTPSSSSSSRLSPMITNERQDTASSENADSNDTEGTGWNSDNDRDRVRELLRPPQFELPPEVEGDPDPELQAKVEKYMKYMEKGIRINDSFKKPLFRNPSIMSKQIEFLGLDEYGSNYPKDIFDPHGFPADAYYDRIYNLLQSGAQQSVYTTPFTGDIGSSATSLPPSLARTISFVSNTLAANRAASSGQEPASSDSNSRPRKSKWDQPGDGDRKRPRTSN
ncbi:HCNGP-like protein-domain-containing protein [Cladochytrium replicatum]|nr:HCNGP-like protein-domain-containing protein [Cladochytrium replicatum]